MKKEMDYAAKTVLSDMDFLTRMHVCMYGICSYVWTPKESHTVISAGYVN